MVAGYGCSLCFLVSCHPLWLLTAFKFLVVMLALWSSVMAVHFAFWFLIVMLALWSSVMAVHFAFWFLIVMLALWSSVMAAHIAP